MAEIGERFWQKVSKDGSCWNWTGYKNSQGYGLVRLDGKMQRAARVVINAPAGMVVRHTCDNPGCVNPQHLRIGTQKQNVADCIKRGRRANCTGEHNNYAKLTTFSVSVLRKSFAAIPRLPSGRKAYGAVQSLARRFGITEANVYSIVNRKTWSHV